MKSIVRTEITPSFSDKVRLTFDVCTPFLDVNKGMGISCSTAGGEMYG